MVRVARVANDNDDDAGEGHNSGDDFNQEKLHTFIERLTDLNEKKNQVQADIKGVFDDAERNGFDRKALKLAFKQIINPVSEELRVKANSYLEAEGKLPLFGGIE